jgi:hypothetical protein
MAGRTGGGGLSALAPRIKLALTLVFALFPAASALASMYGEHKTIGDEAFRRFAYPRGGEGAPELLAYADLRQDERGLDYFAALSVDGGSRISYGALNGLGGDHQRTPRALEAQLRSRTSKLQRIVSLHDRYLSLGHVAAPDGKLARMDFDYALQAAVNLSHFYEYRRTFQEHFEPFDKEVVRRCQDPAHAAAAFGRLNRTNAINAYATLHAAAIDLAERAGHLARTDEEAARTLVHDALLYNGFADHFLEDSFSAGHLVVNREVRDSITNNKALHDFYSGLGTTVVNRRGEIWHAHGDRRFNGRPAAGGRAAPLRDVTPGPDEAEAAPPPYDAEAERIIEAVRLSLDDLGDAFRRASSDPAHVPFLDRIPAEKEPQAAFLMDALSSLRLVPIPYDSDLSTLFAGAEVTDAMRKANQRLSYREFVRSRVGNSFVVGLNRPLLDRGYFRGTELRINVGLLGSGYSHNAVGGKTGVWDHWHGYTASYSRGQVDRGGRDVPARQLRVGLRSNFDRWVTDRKVLGLYGYLEVGVQSAAGRRELVLVPSAGVQMGSLLNLSYYDMPGWLRIPVQFLLPLKFRFGSVISPHRRTRWFSGIEMDFVF